MVLRLSIRDPDTCLCCFLHREEAPGARDDGDLARRLRHGLLLPPPRLREQQAATEGAEAEVVPDDLASRRHSLLLGDDPVQPQHRGPTEVTGFSNLLLLLCEVII